MSSEFEAYRHLFTIYSKVRTMEIRPVFVTVMLTAVWSMLHSR